MNIIIAIDFIDWVGRSWKKSQRPTVSKELAERWISEGKAIDPNNPPEPDQLEELQERSGIKKKRKTSKKNKTD